MRVPFDPIRLGEFAPWWSFNQRMFARQPMARAFDDMGRASKEWGRALKAWRTDTGGYWLLWNGKGVVGEAYTRGPVDACYTGIMLEPEHCGIGAGRVAMELMVDWARDHGVAVLLSSVWEGNKAALRLNLRMGYQVVGHRFINHPYETGDLLVWKLALEV